MPMVTNRRILVSCTALMLFSLSAVPLFAEPAPEEPVSQLWLKGSDQVLAGDFHGAQETMLAINRIAPDYKGVGRTLTWLEEAELLDKSRERYRARMYEYYVKKAHEALEEAREIKAGVAPAKKPEPASDKRVLKDDPSEESRETGEDEEEHKEEDFRWKALAWAQYAIKNAKDEDLFRQEPWLPEAVALAQEAIEEHKAANEWRDALGIYGMLKTIFPDNEEYEAGYDFCRKRAHLEFVYGSEKSNWQSELADVQPSAVRQVLQRIEEDYVGEPDFRELCKSGLEDLVLLAESKSLATAFPTLAERDLVARFTSRLKGLIRNRVEADRPFHAKQVRYVFNKVLKANRDTLRLPEPVIVDEFMAGFLDPLDDFTSVIWPAEVSEFNKQTRGHFVGVGIQITQEYGKPVRVESPLEDSPAFRAGIKPGDLITKVDGKSTVDMTITGAVREITGEAGTIVVLTIKDSISGESRDVPLKRSRIQIRTVRGHVRNPEKPTKWDYLIDPERKIGYIRVGGFMDETVDDLRKALDQLRSEDCHGLILDLRFNPGGLLTSAVNMCELFLDENDPIVQTKGRSRAQNMTIKSHPRANYGDLPLIILVNEYSASASEIVAGALAGLKHACIVGTRTFGKGSVQNLIPIENNQAYLKLTTAHYYVPDSDLPGEDQWYLLHKKPHSTTWGIEPHICVDLIPQEINKVLRLRRERDVLKGIDQQGDIPEEILDRTAETPDDDFPKDEDPGTDPQLVTALNLMRVKLMSHQPWALAPRLDRTAVSTASLEQKVTSQKKH